jgi:hypothetical protein
VLLVAFVGCGNSDHAYKRPDSQAATSGSAAPDACPTRPTREHAKTRFVVNAALAAGAFKRYIYTPHKAGRTKADSSGRKATMTKAALAAVFIVDQLRRAKANAQADPALCRTLLGPLDEFTLAVSGLAGKLKQGQLDPAEIAAGTGLLERVRRGAASVGAGFKDKDVPARMIGG